MYTRKERIIAQVIDLLIVAIGVICLVMLSEIVF